MRLNYSDPQFWKKFHAEHWQPQVPTVLRQPFRDFPFSEAVLLHSLKTYVERLSDGDHRVPCLVSVGDKEVPPRRPLGAVFRRESKTFDELEARCAREFPKKKFGLMVTKMEAVDSVIWEPLTEFLQDAHRYVGYPVARAYVDFFYGNYSSTFTGVHKDIQDIIAFVVRGPKRMLAWPFEYFASRVKGIGPGDKYFNRRLSVDPRKYRKDAIVLDAQAGDVIYWPSHLWHVAEAQPGRFSAMLSLGLFRPSPALPQTPFTKKLLGSALASQDMSDVGGGEDAATRLRWVTGFGFEHGGPVAEGRQKLQGKIAKAAGSLILWEAERASGRLLVAANGHSATFPLSATLQKLLARIASGEAVPVPKKTAAERAAITETYWTKRLEMKTRKAVSGDAAASLVDWLFRVYAVQLVPSRNT